MQSYLHPLRLGAVLLKSPLWSFAPIASFSRGLQSIATQSRIEVDDGPELRQADSNLSRWSRRQEHRKEFAKRRAERKAPSGLLPAVNHASSILHEPHDSISKPFDKALELRKARIVRRNFWQSKQRKLRPKWGFTRRVPAGLQIRKAWSRGRGTQKVCLERTVATAVQLPCSSFHNSKGSPATSPATAQLPTLSPTPAIQADGSFGTRYGEEMAAHEVFLSCKSPLDQYLKERDPSRRNRIWNRVKSTISPDSLPEITLHYLNTSRLPEESWSSLDHTFRRAAIANLEAEGLTLDNVSDWAWILLGNGADEMVHRLCLSDAWNPLFVFAAISWFEIHRVRSLEMLITYAWRHLLPKVEQNKNSPRPRILNDEMEKCSFMEIICRLLYHARRLWPASMVSISNMLVRYIRSIPTGQDDSDSRNLEPRLHKKLSKLYNIGLRLLSLPASKNPMISIVYNWESQKLLLQLASQFKPALLMDQRGYQAVIAVLVASKKSSQESKSATLRARTWPPWRVEQDGMDAQRSPNDDLSRAVLAISQAREAGYVDPVLDDLFRIYGGQDVDGTPTVQRRTLIANRERISSLQHLTPHHLNHFMWRARIQTTRDAFEAWAAFEEFTRIGGVPSQMIYLAMFEKLHFKARRTRQHMPVDIIPGDGMEVLDEACDNFTEFYKSRLQPPDAHSLYKMMLRNGQQPRGRCLAYLVQDIASTVNEGIEFLSDSNIDKDAIRYLIEGASSGLPSQVLQKVPLHVFIAFIRLICRFKPRVEMQKYRKLASPLQHAAFLLRTRSPIYAPAWYAYFNGLSLRDPLVRIHSPEYDSTTWRMLREGLSEFQRIGLELSPYGFQLVCFNFLRYARSAFEADAKDWNAENLEPGLDAAQLLRKEFRRLTSSQERQNQLPKLLHNISGTQLHVYIMCMGMIQDYEEILYTLRWMLDNHKELDFYAQQSANGRKWLRLSLVVTKRFLLQTEHEGVAKAWVDKVDCFGGWPDDGEVEKHAFIDALKMQTFDYKLRKISLPGLLGYSIWEKHQEETEQVDDADNGDDVVL